MRRWTPGPFAGERTDGASSGRAPRRGHAQASWVPRDAGSHVRSSAQGPGLCVSNPLAGLPCGLSSESWWVQGDRLLSGPSATGGALGSREQLPAGTTSTSRGSLLFSEGCRGCQGCRGWSGGVSLVTAPPDWPRGMSGLPPRSWSEPLAGAGWALGRGGLSAVTRQDGVTASPCRSSLDAALLTTFQ